MSLPERLPPGPARATLPDAPEVLPRWKRRLFALVLVAAVLGTTELLARLYLRITRGFDGRHLMQYAYDPYKNILPTPNFVDLRGVRHNAQGFRRSVDTPRAKPPKTLRVFLMGASAAYGLGGQWSHIQRDYAVLKNTETIDAYLEGILRDAFPGWHVEVINAAITATQTHHNLIYLNQSILGYEPDLILSMDGFNDFFYTKPSHDQFADWPYNAWARSIMGEPTLGALAYANAWWLIRRSAGANVIHRGVEIAETQVRARTRANPKRIPANLDTLYAGFKLNFARGPEKMLRRIGLILRDEHVDCVFALQPMLILERGRFARMPEIERKLFEFNVTAGKNYEPYMTRAVPYVREEEAKMAADVGATFLDLTRIFDGVDEWVFTDYVHLTPRGNELIAEYVAPRIRPILAARIQHLERTARN